MNNQKEKCPKCQAVIEADDRFCTICGAARATAGLDLSLTPQATGARKPPSPNEKECLVGVIPQVVEVKGILGLSTSFMTMIVTNKRLILAEQPEEMNDQHTDYEETIEQLIKEEETTWKEFMNSHDFSSAPWMKYQSMEPQAILAEQPTNREILFGAIEDAVLELYSEEEDHMDGLKIRTGGALLDLSLPWGNGLQAQKILSEVLEFSVVQME